MATTIRRQVAAPPARVWAVVTDFAAYGDVIAFTRMFHDPGEPEVGWHFTGRTSLGPIRFDDPMEITRWSPPGPDGRGMFSVVKQGRVLSGWADVGVEPLRTVSGEGSMLTWSEEIRPAFWPGLGRRVGQVADLATNALFSRAVAAMAARAERG